MLSILFYGKVGQIPDKPIYTADFTTDGFDELIQRGLFTLPHCEPVPGHRGIDLGIFRIKVGEIILSCEIRHPNRSELLEVVCKSRYLFAAR